MRFHLTPGFAAARSAREEARANFDRIADRDGHFEADNCPEAKLASEREYAMLDAFLLTPAHTPFEVAEKMRVMREREIGPDWTEKYPHYSAQLERDLFALQRPCVSPPVAAAFDQWRAAHLAHHAFRGDDVEGDRLCVAEADAFVALMRQPCYTPGDLIAKVYTNQLGRLGGRTDGPPFEINTEDLGGARCDAAADEALCRDVTDSDLGRCLVALGRTDFDAAAWLDAADLAGVEVSVVRQKDGTRGLWIGEAEGEAAPIDAERRFIVQALLAGGLGPIGEERRRDVADLIIRSRPDRYHGAEQPAEAA